MVRCLVWMMWTSAPIEGVTQTVAQAAASTAVAHNTQHWLCCFPSSIGRHRLHLKHPVLCRWFWSWYHLFWIAILLLHSYQLIIPNHHHIWPKSTCRIVFHKIWLSSLPSLSPVCVCGLRQIRRYRKSNMVMLLFSFDFVVKNCVKLHWSS